MKQRQVCANCFVVKRRLNLVRVGVGWLDGISGLWVVDGGLRWGNERWMRIEWSVVGGWIGVVLNYLKWRISVGTYRFAGMWRSLGSIFFGNFPTPRAIYSVFHNFSSFYFLKYLYVKIAYIITRHYSNNHKNYLILPCLGSDRPKDYSSPKF